MKTTIIHSRLNPRLEVSLIAGHFATRHSHNSHYIDITRMKHEHTMAREAAMTLAQRYAYEKGVDTIVCLDGSEVIGAFLARHLAKNTLFAVNGSKNINIVTPEYDSSGLMIFRDNLIPMIAGQNVLILISTINSGKSGRRVSECVEYYGGKVQGIAAVFSSMEELDGWYHINSGGIDGYISSEYVLTGEEAREAAEGLVMDRAIVLTDNLNIRQEPSTDANVMGQCLEGERYEIIGETDEWYQIPSGYISKEYS